ncbi:hypothetical protein SAMN03097708_02894 [Thiohalomonas denitrificans]|uniref:Uncharacterized protein n=1 Tax=Thiohalomonas denitrificans TaxID=415747 RepID=A0A1G5QVL0_9GAMM|nr:hypothetical protein SAMN03097708_02894 [Thiohalomonas denitrificans]
MAGVEEVQWIGTYLPLEIADKVSLVAGVLSQSRRLPGPAPSNSKQPAFDLHRLAKCLGPVPTAFRKWRYNCRGPRPQFLATSPTLMQPWARSISFTGLSTTGVGSASEYPFQKKILQEGQPQSVIGCLYQPLLHFSGCWDYFTQWSAVRERTAIPEKKKVKTGGRKLNPYEPHPTWHPGHEHIMTTWPRQTALGTSPDRHRQTAGSFRHRRQTSGISRRLAAGPCKNRYPTHFGCAGGGSHRVVTLPSWVVLHGITAWLVRYVLYRSARLWRILI